MVSSDNGKCTDEILEELGPGIETNGNGMKHQLPLYVGTSQRGLLDEKRHKNKYPSSVIPSKAGFIKFKPSVLLSSSSAKFKQIAMEKDDVSRSVPTPTVQSIPQRFSIPFLKDINWASLRELCKEWIRNPLNMALFVWIVCVAISGAILFMVMTGMLNHQLPRKSQRDGWFEVNNQILNALFTLMCLYQHPKRFYHLILLCRWQQKDVIRLRKEYCKNGAYKPNEWMHMMVVVALLHLNCFAQYALCGLNLGYPRSKRPAIGVGLCVSVSFGAAAGASVYTILSPLGREYETGIDHEAQDQITSTDSGQPVNLQVKSLEKRYSFVVREDQSVSESRPEWIGGLFDFWDNLSLAYLSLFCSCCVFGWNMGRLGFGNMYVHIATFVLLCIAPFFIFNLAAINIDNTAVREALGLTGIVLCVFGLLYGGFWRIMMRKRFNLPAYTFCCGNPEVTDCFQWLCCCSCSLAQEVRTADYYDVVEDKLYLKRNAEGGAEIVMSPLPREDGMPLFNSRPSSPYMDRLSPASSNAASPERGRSSPTSPYNGKASPPYFQTRNSPRPSRLSGDTHLPTVDEDSAVTSKDDVMRPPIFSGIQ